MPHWAAPSSQFLSGTVMPICHFGGLGQGLQLHSPRSRWSSHPFLPLLPPLASPPAPLRARTWAKANTASQHLLLPEKRVLGCHGDQVHLPIVPQPSCREGGRQLGWESGRWTVIHIEITGKKCPPPPSTHTHTHTHTHIHTHTHLELEKEWAECEVCCDCDLLLCTALSVNRDALMCRTTCRCDWNMFQWVCLYETMFILLVCLAGLCVL